MSQAAMRTGEVMHNIEGLAHLNEDAQTAAGEVLSSASELSRQSEHLNAEMVRFLSTIRAA